MKKRLNQAVEMIINPVFGDISAKVRMMALSVQKNSMRPYLGLAREITKSQGSVDIPGFIDQSKLIIVQSNDLLSWKKVKDLEIEGIEEIKKKYVKDDKYFIGLEDPDIIEENGLLHVYYTIAYKYKNKIGYEIYLGHAQGESLGTLKATDPTMSPFGDFDGFKEACISEKAYRGIRINLLEAGLTLNNNISMIVSAKTKKLDKPWKYERIVVDPRKIEYDWCKVCASPCRFFPEDFVELKNKDLVVGLMNGREQEKIIDNQKVYGKFRPGLFIFNAKSGEVLWIAKEPLIEDPDARTITFASDFVQISEAKGILYAHVNDSFVRAYEIDSGELKKLIPQEFI